MIEDETKRRRADGALSEIARENAEGAPRPTGVLLVNTGTPDAPTSAAVRRYLAEFLADPLVVDANRFVWWLVLNGIVLPFRSPRSAALYREVWTPEGSPLLVNSIRQRDRIAAELGPDYAVVLAMRYGRPSIAAGLRRLLESGVSRVVLLPLFPQASRATTGTVEREVRRVLGEGAPDIDLEVVAPFYADAGYVQAVCARIAERLAEGPVDRVVLSFHGLPVRYVEEGDPYSAHCERTAELVARGLGLERGEWSLAYQSRFGREPWLEPDVAELVPAFAPDHARVLVACPGFTADCLETLEEIDGRLRRSFEEAGGEELRFVPSLNDHPEWITAAARLVREAATA